ncbi:hypothetical protein GGI12_001396 [Dipsacomyces acuminosporus]|nr:hypothetical protein GGI12_001396 [Dipsacomyces acuminosporus]
MFGLITRVFCVSAGYLYPAYKCFKLLRRGPEATNASPDASEQRDVVKGILKYWIVMAGFTAGELQRLRDIRARKSQLQDMVAQLESSERAILAKQAPPVVENDSAEPIRKNPAEDDGFERDAVIVSDSGTESSSEARKDASPPKDKAENTASRRWFW